MHPRIKFRRNEKKDLEIVHTFIKDAEYDKGMSLVWAVFNKYPQLKKLFNENKGYEIKDESVLSHFIYKKYHDRQMAMDRALEQHKKCWEQMAPRYFSLVDTLFNNRTWPEGNYIDFGTIWGMYPRFLKDKTFQVPYWHRTPRYVSVVIAHELLHFMFYDYFYERYPRYHRPKDNLFVWNISEIFNTVVQNSPEWVDCFELKSIGYPEHKKIVARISATLHDYDR